MKLKTMILIFAGIGLVWGQAAPRDSTKKGADNKSRHAKKKRARQSNGQQPDTSAATRTSDPITPENPMDPKGPTNSKNPVPPRTPINPDTPTGPKDPPRPPAATPPQP